MTEKEWLPYQVERIQSWEEFVHKVQNPPYVNWAYRGHADTNWPLMSSLGRYLNTYIHQEHWIDQEWKILRIFQRKAHIYLANPPPREDVFQWLALMEHHGGPTRLLDFTWSPYVAAFFALERAEETAAVWALNPENMENVTERLNEFLGGLNEGLMPRLDAVRDSDSLGYGEPFVMNSRLIAQSGTFVVSRHVGIPIETLVMRKPYPADTLVKFELPRDLVRKEGLRRLYTMNITNATLFPDLDGLARSLAYELEFHWAYDPQKKRPADD